jgi:RNA polymerase sigma-70 factor (ECF subfamily)
MKSFCRKLLADPGDAEDAAQSALIRLFEQASDYDPTRDGLSWALEIALWECRTARARRARSREEELGESALKVADAAPSPEADAGRRQLEQALAGALSELSEGDRAALLEQLSPRGETVAPATWRKRRERALKRLRLLWRTQHGS